MKDNDVKIGDLIKRSRDHGEDPYVEEYGLVVKTSTGIASFSCCQPTILWGNGEMTTHVSSMGMEIISESW